MNVYDLIQKEIIQKRETIRNLTGTPSEMPSKILGDFYEDIIRDITRRIIPPKYKVYTGIIVELTQTEEVSKVSKELDIIIVDGNISYPLFLSNDLIITKPDYVNVVVQIKSVLSTANVKSAKRNLSSVKRIKNIPTVLIGFKRNLTYDHMKTMAEMDIDEIIYFTDNKDNLENGQFKKYVQFLHRYLPS